MGEKSFRVAYILTKRVVGKVVQAKLLPHEGKLLREVITRWRPDLLYLLNRLGNSLLTIEQREEIREAIADELIASGLDENNEPTQRGIMLEELIDRLWYFSEEAAIYRR